MSAYFLENINMASKTLFANKLRSGLTMLGVIIGNASVIAMVAVGQGGQRYINQQFESLGTNVLFVSPGVDQRGPQAGVVQANTLVLEDAEAIAQEVLAITAVAPEKSERLRVTYGNKETQVTITGTTPEYPTVRDVQVAQGEFFNILDIQTSDQVAVLGSDTARTLFGKQNPLGQKIRIRNLGFKVIGVMAEKGASLGQNQDEAVFIPIMVMANQITGQEANSNSPTLQSIAVMTKNPESSSAAQYQITNLLRLRHNLIKSEDDFTVRSQQDLMETANRVSDIMVLVLGATAGISLVVGGIGIMNIMLVSVVERTKEIGLRKALGATGSDILIQFTIEAIILSTVGGLIGIGLGVGGTIAVATLTPLEAVVSFQAIFIALTVSGAIGLFFGVFPARNAAQLDPIIALRS
ncbi:ABC transporter permease [Pleurocapsa sp. CCALA 161]|uniref:ABC transporter permease n=1 Tax=Pleurocapsa sp. CCALA 161 TaxID=2107688 RepID=UPI000D0594C2|nr:ABC transporter permease [Pleurocapsa sp. CCALA 161]PSB09016.1 ABC transporter permease [Pleurocapsa sp. CCALA 161]